MLGYAGWPSCGRWAFVSKMGVWLALAWGACCTHGSLRQCQNGVRKNLELVGQDCLGGAVEVRAERLLQQVGVAIDKFVNAVLVQTVSWGRWWTIPSSEGTGSE